LHSLFPGRSSQHKYYNKKKKKERKEHAQQQQVSAFYNINTNKMLSYRRKTALQGTLVLAKSGRLELGDNILRTI